MEKTATTEKIYGRENSNEKRKFQIKVYKCGAVFECFFRKKFIKISHRLLYATSWTYYLNNINIIKHVAIYF